MVKRPRIGITMRLEMDSRRFYLGRDYSEAVEAAGGTPIHLALIPKPEYIASALDGLDGILLPGSDSDVDPIYYGEEPRPELGSVIEERDETDRLVIEESERRNLPILAICYGMQALNVSRGGTLIQDIRTQVEGSIKHEQGIPIARNSHRIKIAEDCVLSCLDAVRSSDGPIRVNSSHHQAVGELGRDLKAVAWAADGVVECVEGELSGPFILGVQWHPELSAERDALSRQIFELFVEKCGSNGL